MDTSKEKKIDFRPDFDFAKAEKAYKEIDSLNYKSSKEKIETAVKICRRFGINYSDLLLYEKHITKTQTG